MVSIETFKFLSMVAPTSNDTWITIHHTVCSCRVEKDPIFPGNAHKTVQTAQKDAEYWARKGHCTYLDGYVPQLGCAGSALPAMPSARHQNLLACRNLYLDVDVKADGYKAVDEMKLAVQGFLEWAKLPPPTVIVGSGSGGWHIYWTLDTAVDRTEFTNLARRLVAAAVEYGLIFDRQCTVDATRLLRVAGTWNFKYATSETPATPVTLDYNGGVHVSINEITKSLSRWKPLTDNPAGNLSGKGCIAIMVQMFMACRLTRTPT